LRIIEDYISDGNRTTELVLEELLTALTPVVYNKTAQTVMLKSIVLDLRWFDGN